MTTVLIVVGAVAAYALFALASPTTGCRAAPASAPRAGGGAPAAAAAAPAPGFRPGAPLVYRAISRYRRHRANGNLTLPPLRPPRDHP